MNPKIKTLFHADTNTCCHLVWDPGTKKAVIIDPVLDFDPASGRIATTFADELVKFIQQADLAIEYILETHAHADHVTAAQYLKKLFDCPVGIGGGICSVQKIFVSALNLNNVPTDGSQFDRLFHDDEEFEVGGMTVRVLHTPGHTNDSVTYLIGNTMFVGDTLFMPDFGTARCDFPGGDAEMLHASIEKIFSLPEDTRLMLCHDYGEQGREIQWETTVMEERETNIHLTGRTREQFVALRKERDAQLNVPRLLYPSIQVNIRAGHMPDAEENGVVYLKIPLDQS
ncbi:MAG: MBL fold metallo-hydrolase [Gammaproteobacteria bacterium]